MGSDKLPQLRGFAMRTLLISIALTGLLAAGLPPAALAQANRPADLQPIPEPPPPPAPLDGSDVSTEPQVTIIQRGDDKVEEYRVNGKLYMVKVTPPHGKPYYLMDENGSGAMTRYDDMDSGLRVPKWVIFTFD
jgi:hypothetical protein